jgi:hypothetical protein
MDERADKVKLYLLCREVANLLGKEKVDCYERDQAVVEN